jgi:hypothetical protein
VEGDPLFELVDGEQLFIFAIVTEAQAQAP